MNAKYNLTIPQNNIWLVENFYDDKSINIIAGTFTIKTGFNIELAKKNNDSNYTFCNWDDEDFYREINLLKNKRKQILGE